MAQVRRWPVFGCACVGRSGDAQAVALGMSSAQAVPGMVSTLAGSGAPRYADGLGTSASFATPLTVAVIPYDSVVVVGEFENNRIRLISPLGNVTTLAGSVDGFADGTGSAAMFSEPRGLAVLPPGSGFGTDPLTWLIVVSDYGNNCLRLITYPCGVVTTLAGSSIGFDDGLGTAASFSGPTDIAVVSSASIVVADSNNHRLRLVTPAGRVSTFAGSVPGFADGSGRSARFNHPAGVTVRPTGTIAVADSDYNCIHLNCIHLVTPGGAVTTLAGTEQGFAYGVGTSARFHAPLLSAVLTSSNNLAVPDFDTTAFALSVPRALSLRLRGVEWRRLRTAHPRLRASGLQHRCRPFKRPPCRGRRE